MAERKKTKIVSLHRPFLWALVLGAFALGVFVDRGLMLVTGGQQEEPEGRTTAALEASVNKHVERTLAAGDASALSLYFQDLGTGHWFGIREDEDFPPQGLLKLPVMMVCFKQAGAQRGFRHRDVRHHQLDADAHQQEPPRRPVRARVVRRARPQVRRAPGRAALQRGGQPAALPDQPA